MKINHTITALLFFVQIAICSAQEEKIKLPDTNDKYAGYVKKLESGETNIDYTDFRNSFVDSKMFSEKSTNYRDLQKKMFEALKNSNYNEVIKFAKSMLSIDYTSMTAHMYLQKTYKILGDTANSKKYHDIEFGLINSIVNSGDGKTCDTGWHVTQIEEEYFIINVVLSGQPQQQSIAQGSKNACDRMVIKNEKGETETFFFEANKVFEAEAKMFGGN